MDNVISKKIEDIVFKVMSPKFIKEMASAKIVTPELYDKEGYPVDGGLMDIRMGVIDPGLNCKTCGSKLKECIGHFGYIELARPVVHIEFVKLVKDLLRGTCSECNRVMIPEDKISGYKEELDELSETLGPVDRAAKVTKIISRLRTIKKCPHCDAKNEKITLEKPSTYHEGEKRLTPTKIRARLERISDEDVALFGINPESMRPEWAVLTLLPIPPVTMRPSITLESGERSEDDLTHKLGDIVRINQRLFENINAGAPEIIIEDLWDLLQYHVTTFFNNSISQLPPARHRSGQPLKTIKDRIKSKEGRIRRNLAGKRTNFSARTVISPDPGLEINEVGVPKTMAMKLTIPEKVTDWNMDYLKKFIKRGADTYPGANYIIRPDGRRKRITDETREQLLEELEPGFVVERHLMDGDLSLFNRQPSLHRMSMMCHKIKVLPGSTLRLNPGVCAPYNADFDGDEMNLHIPQTEEARAEAEILMQVQTQIISPRYGLSIIGCNQDAISGNFILTKQLGKISREDAIEILSKIGVEDYSGLPDTEKVSGKDVFSVLLPDDLNFKEEGDEDDPGVVEIRQGKLIKGYLGENNLGIGKGLLLRMLYNKYGPEKSVKYLGMIYKLGIEVLEKYGFTSRISDLDLPDKSEKKVKEILEDAEDDVNELIKKYREGTLDQYPGKSLEETLELKILERLNEARDNAGKIAADSIDSETGTMTMVESGARGNLINISQMSACVGQQALRGGRINKGYKERTLSCFKKNDLSSKARGFIKNSFKSGLEPHEMFFMAVTGRDSLMDTALRTPKSGYLYRRLSNALQDLKVEYDDTVRDGSGRIVQFNYGEDSVDVSKSEGGKINVKKIIETEMFKKESAEKKKE